MQRKIKGDIANTKAKIISSNIFDRVLFTSLRRIYAN
jgi:hypothetical protein